MERSKYIIVVLALTSISFSYQRNLRVEIYVAYINNDMKSWKKVIDEMEAQTHKNKSFYTELINFQYGYVAWCIGSKKHKEAEKYLDLAEKNLRIVGKLDGDQSFVSSYKAAFYGFRIGLHKIRAPFYGPKSIENAKLAIKQDNKNPYGYIQYGNAQYYMPAVFGGSKSAAIEYFRKAEELMEQQGNVKNDWNYMSLLTLIAKAYAETGNYVTSKAYYEKILRIEPNFLWVKNELYPKLLKKK